MKIKHMFWSILLIGAMSYGGYGSKTYAAGGSGTISDPYLISTCTELQNIKNDLTAHYALSTNIDCAETTAWNGGKGFQPIGDFNTRFSGSLDGKGYAISNLYIGRPTDQFNALFGGIEGPNAAVRNLTISNMTNTGAFAYLATLAAYVYTGTVIENVTVTNSSIGTAGAADIVGGLVGYFRGSLIKNAQVNMTVKGDEQVGGIVGYLSGGVGATVTQSSFNGTIDGSYRVGGIAGYVITTSTITKSFAKGSLRITAGTITNTSVGGLVGHTKTSTIEDSFSSMNISCLSGCGSSITAVGGAIGNHESGTVKNTYSNGAILTGTASKGGFIGLYTAGTITNSFWDKNTSGLTTSAAGTGKTTAEMKTQATFTGYDFTNTWVLKSSLNNGYPTLKQTPPPKLWEVSGLAETHSDTSVSLSWVSPVDSEFDFVNIYRNGVKIATSTTQTYTNMGLTSDVSYTYKVTTVDTRGNESSGKTIVVKTTDVIPPNPVTGLTATEASGQVQLNWTNPTTLDFDHVTVKRNGTTIYTGNAQAFLDTTVAEKTTYTYQVVAYDDDGNASTSVQKVLTTLDRTPPAVVSNIAATEESTGVKVTWTNPSDSDFSNVIVTRNGTVVYSGTASLFLDTTVAEKTTYTYAIKALDYDGNQSASVSVTIKTLDKTPPHPVTSVVLTEENDHLLLRWVNPGDSDLQDIQVFKNGIKVYEGVANTFSDFTYAEKTTYTYEIRAVDDSGNVSTGKSQSIYTMDKTPPANVSNVHLTEENGELHLVWTNPGDDDIDYIQIKKNGAIVYQGNAEVFLDSSFLEKTNYTYELTAVDTSGNNSSTVSVSITTEDHTAPGPVTDVTLTEESDHLQLNWVNPGDSDVQKIQVFKNGTKVYEGNETTFSDTFYTEKTTYTYEIYVIDDSGNVSPSAFKSIHTKDKTPPNSVNNAMLEEANGVLKLTWKNPLNDDIDYIQVKKNGVVVYQGTKEVVEDVLFSEKTTYTYELTVVDTSGNKSSTISISITTEDHTAPGPITAFTLVEENDHLSLRWTNPLDSDVQLIRVRKNGILVYEGLGNTFSDTNYAEKTLYTYEIQVLDHSGNVSTSVYRTISTKDKTPPQPVENVRTKEENGKILITWKKPADDDLASIQVKKNGVLIYQGNATIYEDTSFDEKTTYTYTLTVVDTSGLLSSDVSASITTKDVTPPQPVTDVVLTEEEDHLLLTWKNPTDSDLAYIRVYKNGTILYEGMGTTVADHHYAEKTTYTYAIVAVDTSGNESTIIRKQLTPLDKTPTAPVSRLSVKERNKMIRLSWVNPSDSDFAYVQIKKNGVLVYQGSARHWEDTIIEENKVYIYEVVAVDKSGNLSIPTKISVLTQKHLAPSDEKMREPSKKPEEVKTRPIHQVDHDQKTLIEKERQQVIASFSMTKKSKKFEIKWKKSMYYPKATIYLDGVFLKETTENIFSDFMPQDGKNHRYTLVFSSKEGEQIVKEFLFLSEKSSISPTKQPQVKDKKTEKPSGKINYWWITSTLLITFIISMWLIQRRYQKK